MARVVWSLRAHKDVQIHFARIAGDSVTADRKWMRRVRAAVDQLASFPEIGSPVEEFEDSSVREQIVGNYRVIYRYEKGFCVIGRILRAERDFHPDDFSDSFR